MTSVLQVTSIKAHTFLYTVHWWYCVPKTVCNMRLDTLEVWYQEANVSTLLLVIRPQALKWKNTPNFSTDGLKNAKKNGKISHFENLDFWLWFKRKSFETKPLLLVMVHFMFHIMQTFGLSEIWGSEKKHPHFKLKSNCHTVGIRQNPASHNSFGKFSLGIWIYFRFFSIFVAKRRFSIESTQKMKFKVSCQ